MPEPSRHHHAGQVGSSTTELVLLMPVVLLLVMLIVQFGLWLHAQHVASAAAQEGLLAAQVESGTSVAGHDRAEAFLTQAGGLREVRIDAARDTDHARVEITGTTPMVVPGMSLRVTAVVEGPAERFVAEPDR